VEGENVIIKAFNRPVRPTLLAAIAAAAIGMPGTSASAEGLFGFLFGASPARSMPASASAYSDPFSLFGTPAAPQPIETPASGGSVAYCVRLCDGRFFPIQRSNGADPAQICSGFCPAAQTKIFSGSGIDHASARDGARYADLKNAFAYREKTIPGCTCDGKDAFGLVNTPAAADPTLRAGDVVATNTGFVTYTGGRRNAEFTPVTGEMRSRLAQFRIVPSNASPVVPTRQTVAADNDGRRHQASR
jgi:hypothetical protein